MLKGKFTSILLNLKNCEGDRGNPVLSPRVSLLEGVSLIDSIAKSDTEEERISTHKSFKGIPLHPPQGTFGSSGLFISSFHKYS